MNELVKYEIDGRVKRLKAKQQNEVTELKESNLEELKSFNNEWKERFRQLQEQENILRKNMKDKHNVERSELKQNVAQSLPKLTPELLNLTEMRKKMLKAKRFKEAECINSKVKELKEKLYSDWLKKQKERLDSLGVNLISKQELELRGLNIRIESVMEDQKKLKRKELETLLNKHQNSLRDLETKHNMEQQECNKAINKCNFV